MVHAVTSVDLNQNLNMNSQDHHVAIRIGICIIAQADSDVWNEDSIYLLFSWPLHYIASGFTNTSTLKVSKINMVISQTP